MGAERSFKNLLNRLNLRTIDVSHDVSLDIVCQSYIRDIFPHESEVRITNKVMELRHEKKLWTYHFLNKRQVQIYVSEKSRLLERVKIELSYSTLHDEWRGQSNYIPISPDCEDAKNATNLLKSPAGKHFIDEYVTNHAKDAKSMEKNTHGEFNYIRMLANAKQSNLAI